MLEAEIDNEGRVLRVVVSPEAGWAAANLGGTWVETVKGDDVATYAGPGHLHDPGIIEQFVWDEWTAAKAQTPVVYNGRVTWGYNELGQLTWFNGRGWRNLLPTGSPNTFAPPTNWREYPMGDAHPLWVQPSGAYDAYPVDFVVEHEGQAWTSTTPANVWEPGVFGWTVI